MLNEAITNQAVEIEQAAQTGMSGAYHVAFNTPTQEQGRAGCYWSRTARPGFFPDQTKKKGRNPAGIPALL
jgi:hypothetical protein